MDGSKGRKSLSLKGKSEGKAEQHMLHANWINLNVDEAK